MFTSVTRREMLALLGATASLGFAGPAQQSPSRPIIRTLLKDVEPGAIAGSTLFHEHLSIRYPLTRALAAAQGRDVPPSFTDDVDLMVAETRLAGEDELARDAREQRLGAFGEIGQQAGVLTDDEKKVFTAVGKAQAKTGIPIFTHNAYFGTLQTTPVPMDAALKQLDVLEAAGADPKHVAIGHVCCLDDVKAEIPKQLAKRGVFVGFDRVTIPIISDAQKVTTILAFLEAGYADQLLLSSDFSNGRALKKNGGPGIAQTVTVFGPMLTKAGVPETTLRRILVDNPRRFLAFTPKMV